MALTPPKYVMVRLPRDLSKRVDETRPATVSREAFVRRAVEAALSDDTQGGGSRPDEAHSHTESHASATGAVTARGASRPTAPPRASERATPEQVAATTGHHAGCGCIRCDDVRTGRKPIA